MADTFIKAYPYNGHDLTIWLDENTGAPYTDPATGVTENTHIITSAIDTLSTTSITAGATSDTLTDVAMASLRVSAITINGGDKIYTNAFQKMEPGNSLTLTDGINTFTSGDAVVLYYLPSGSGTEYPDIRKRYLGRDLPAAENALKAEVDAVSDQEIYNLLTGLGYSLD